MSLLLPVACLAIRERGGIVGCAGMIRRYAACGVWMNGLTFPLFLGILAGFSYDNNLLVLVICLSSVAQ